MTPPPPIAGGYRVVLADCPWYFENRSPKGELKNPVRHYSCMRTPDICALAGQIGLDFICAPDCALVLWATFPMLPDALEVMSRWGFAYKGGGAWGKLQNGRPAFGAGYIYRSAAEIWILGTRGAPKVRSHSVRNLILAERREHSRKPDEMHADLERLYDGPFLELFARQRRPGWTSWGNETEKFSEAAE